jgi:uncharacterized protein (TIGR03435 family)
MENQPLSRLIELAYDLSDFQVLAPAWTNDARFDIIAKCPPFSSQLDQSLMLRRFLEERFKLAVHHDSSRLTGFALLVAQGGFRLKPLQPDGGGAVWDDGISTIPAKGTSVRQLARVLSRRLGKTVMDGTGIDGLYDFDGLRLARPAQSRNPADSVLVLSTLLREIGLRLQQRKAPVDIVVVDSVESSPTANHPL